MQTYVSGHDLWGCQRTAIQSQYPNNNLVTETSIQISQLNLPPWYYSWGYFRLDLTPFKGIKRILNAFLSLYVTGYGGTSRILSFREPTVNLIDPSLLKWNNQPSMIDIGIPDINVPAAVGLIQINISKIIQAIVEGRRENKGLFVIPSIANGSADCLVTISSVRYPTAHYPSAYIEVDPTLQSPKHRPTLQEVI
jgi:hypothetical protein